VIGLVVVLAGLESWGVRSYLVHWRDTIGLWQYMLSRAPNSAGLYSGLGTAYQEIGDLDRAAEFYKRALDLPSSPLEVRVNLGVILLMRKQYDAAIEHFSAVLQLAEGDYHRLLGHYFLGCAFLEMGRTAEAVQHLRSAADLKANDPFVHFGLGMALYRDGQGSEAIPEWELALQLGVEPTGNRVAALWKMAWVWASSPDSAVRNAARAQQAAREACRLSGERNPLALNALAAAYAAAGQFDQAVAASERAVHLAQEAGQSQQAKSLRQWLKLYQAGKPYIEQKPLAW
jgi:tetratricopeptide (TPR) repeat protein